MDRWEANIEKVVNGYIVRHLAEREDGTKYLQTVVFQGPETEGGENESMKNLLYYIKEFFGVYYDKHNEKNLIIGIEGEYDGEIH